jgi:hypothetical protein
MPAQSMTPGSSPLPGAFRSTMRWTPTGTAASGTSVRGPTVPLVSSSTSRPSASSARRRSTTAGCSSGSPPVTSTVRGPSSRTRASTASTAERLAAVEGVGRVAPPAADMAAGQPHERARATAELRLAADRPVDFTDQEHVPVHRRRERRAAEAARPRMRAYRLSQRGNTGAMSTGIWSSFASASASTSGMPP